jgi:hypothetical protein
VISLTMCSDDVARLVQWVVGDPKFSSGSTYTCKLRRTLERPALVSANHTMDYRHVW